MDGTEDVWAEWNAEMDKAKFSLIAAELLLEEFENIDIDDWKTLKDYKRRHKLHIRAANHHRRRASRIMRRIERRQRKEGKSV